MTHPKNVGPVGLRYGGGDPTGPRPLTVKKGRHRQQGRGLSQRLDEIRMAGFPVSCRTQNF